MAGFSDIENSSVDVGSEVDEVEAPDVDFGDGDGVNDFDDTYESMNNGDENMEYSQETPENQQPVENNTEEQNRSDMTTDENIDDVLSDFEDEADEAEPETATDDTSEAEPDHTEKNAVFENVSYHQGQNDLGALGTCGPTSIANSLNRVTGSTEYTENKVLHNAMDHNLCRKSDNPYSCGGTTTRDVVNIIDNVKNPDDNIHTEVYEYDRALSVEELANRLDDSGTVAMVGVDSATLWDQRGDVACSGLFQHTDSPSDHWITVDSPIRDEAGSLTGFNVIDSGGGVSEVSREKFEAMYMGDAGNTVSDPTAVIISNNGESENLYASPEGHERTSHYKGSEDASSDEAKEINDKFRGDQIYND